MRDFFISYNQSDERWAEWIAWTLADAGYTHYFQKWDFRPGGNFVLEMQKAAADSHRIILVLSPNYLRSLFTQPEWAAFFTRDPTGEKRLIIPCRVERCEVAGMLTSLVYCDLMDLEVGDARDRLLSALRPSGKPAAAPAFPGAASTLTAFPGPATTVPPVADPVRAAAEELRTIFATSGTTFEAQAKLRDDLARRIRDRLDVRGHHEYEELFDLYFARLNSEELRLHRTIRAYTESILHEYNTRSLQVIERESRLAQFLPSVPELKQHLIIWIKKFENIFRRTPSMCLVYVGVEEEVGFPSEITDELEYYLSTGQPAPKRTRTSRERYSEAEGGSERRLWVELQRAYEDRRHRFEAFEQRLAELTRHHGAGSSTEFDHEQLAAVEVAYSQLLAERAPAHTLLPEGFDWVPRLKALTSEIESAVGPELPPQVHEAVRGLRALPRTSSDWIHTQLTNALPRLAVLKRYEQGLGLGSKVSDAWKELLALLRSRVR